MSKKNGGNRQQVTIEELALSNMISIEALVQLLVEKGLLTEAEILERVRKVQEESKRNSP